MGKKKPKVDLTEDRIFPLGFGIVCGHVCAPKSWSRKRIEDEVSRQNPPGTSANKWVISDPNNSRTDEYKGKNCLPCPDDPNRQHWLLNC